MGNISYSTTITTTTEKVAKVSADFSNLAKKLPTICTAEIKTISDTANAEKETAERNQANVNLNTQLLFNAIKQIYTDNPQLDLMVGGKLVVKGGYNRTEPELHKATYDIKEHKWCSYVNTFQLVLNHNSVDHHICTIRCHKSTLYENIEDMEIKVYIPNWNGHHTFHLTHDRTYAVDFRPTTFGELTELLNSEIADHWDIYKRQLVRDTMYK